jgi:(p)ppGpp synthase/HD superfamily hydrolase
MIAHAIKLAAEVHTDQVDKGGEAYILHALAVMHSVDTGSRFDVSKFREELMTVAVLHDVLEDFKGTAMARQQLHYDITVMFGDRVYEALTCLTKQRNEPYEDYIERAASNPIARRVKIADLTHNMDTGRLPEGEIGEKDFARWDKYRRALVRLERS